MREQGRGKWTGRRRVPGTITFLRNENWHTRAGCQKHDFYLGSFDGIGLFPRSFAKLPDFLLHFFFAVLRHIGQIKLMNWIQTLSIKLRAVTFDPYANIRVCIHIHRGPRWNDRNIVFTYCSSVHITPTNVLAAVVCPVTRDGTRYCTFCW